MEDAEIITMLEQRDERALREIRSKYGGKCRDIARRLTGNMQDAEEILSDTLMQTWNTIPPARPDNLFAFLSALTKRLSINRFQREHAQKRGGRAAQIAIEELEGCVPSTDNIEEEADRRALTEALECFLDSLPPEPRCILVQRYVNLHTVREIAEAYCISESKIKVTLLRMRHKLRKFLEEEGWL